MSQQAEQSKKEIAYLVTVTVDGRAQVSKRDYTKMFEESDGLLTIDDMKWIDKNVHDDTMRGAIVPEGKKQIMLISSSGNEVVVPLREIYQEDFKQVLDLKEGEKLKSFKFL